MSVTAARGFVAGGLACGIKDSGAPDLAIVATADARAVPAAGVFTSNRATAAPVQVSRAHLAATPHAAAVVLSSGNANAATGEQGRRDATRMCELTADGLGCTTQDVLVCSTGLIGIPMPMHALEAGIPKLTSSLNGSDAAAEAILTTDTVRKEAVAPVSGTAAVVGGMAKGAAMLAPSMATMLAVLTTDAAVDAPALHDALTRAVDVSFNQLCVDACTSTNDTVLVLANGATGESPSHDALVDAMTIVCASLAEQMARDAEGATKLARVVVRNAASVDDARRAAHAVARSQLVQCSLNGSDPYWGRVLSELGASGAQLDPEAVDIAYGSVVVCRNGIAAGHDAAALAQTMQAREITIECDLHRGDGNATVLTTDLSHGYIDENRRTS
ncbi:MAG TPA: bifunctional glutamate N-acetyltransferase/amino-acid acetyltransferase ArgJ [Acidimicrobiia bacterium]|nr:bifunctional glutamate N-acetyltransferase/amino-acid acetyltransferase ArgJ [Acidimicrobiia bacterium]